MAKTISYNERPPATARTARKAWDYFVKRYATTNRPIGEMSYSPNFRYDGPAWICILEILENDLYYWNFSEDDVMFHIHSGNLAYM